MSYFQSTGLTCNHFITDWTELVNEIRGWSSWNISRDISQPLEAEALYIFTMARHVLKTASRLPNPVENGWMGVFLEGTILLYPMIELLGYARLDKVEVSAEMSRRYKNKHPSSDVSMFNLWAGLHWLETPGTLLQVTPNIDPKDDPALFQGQWQIGHLVSLRNYLLHGAKIVREKNAIITVEDIISHTFPQHVIQCAQIALREYWNQLKNDDGTHGWLSRLADSEIRPLKIQGSEIWEKGMVDPDIVECLEGPKGFPG